MDPWRKAQFDKLKASGYLDAYEDMVRRMNVPFFWSDADGLILANGTLCLIDTGTRKIGVTCDHVYDEYLKARLKDDHVETQFGGTTVYPETRLIARDHVLDLATFDVPEVLVYASEESFYHTPPKWPPNPVSMEDVVLYGGYPQSERIVRHGNVNSGFQYFATRVNSVDPEKIALEPSVQDVYWPGHDGEPINDRFGGHSGGPVYRVIDGGMNGELLDRVELVGFIYNKVFDLIFARHVRHVGAGGTLASSFALSPGPR
jgi:hypothetical protein